MTDHMEKNPKLPRKHKNSEGHNTAMQDSCEINAQQNKMDDCQALQFLCYTQSREVDDFK